MVYQLTPALLDAMVLAIAEDEDAYGYMIAQRLKNIASQKESSLYPVLKRLLEAGLLETYDQEYQGRNRRYYRITEEGRIQAIERGGISHQNYPGQKVRIHLHVQTA